MQQKCTAHFNIQRRRPYHTQILDSELVFYGNAETGKILCRNASSEEMQDSVSKPTPVTLLSGVARLHSRYCPHNLYTDHIHQATARHVTKGETADWNLSRVCLPAC